MEMIASALLISSKILILTSLLLWAYICYDCSDATVVLWASYIYFPESGNFHRQCFGLVAELYSVSLG